MRGKSSAAVQTKTSRGLIVVKSPVREITSIELDRGTFKGFHNNDND